MFHCTSGSRLWRATLLPMNRRDLLRYAPAVALLASETASAQQQPQPQESKFTRDQLRQALSFAGLDFKDEHLDMMLPSVNRSLANYTSLRKIAVPLDTDPAFRPVSTAFS